MNTQKKDIVISVVVPVYKAEKYLVQCVNSLMKQTYSMIEIVLVDDGSPDSCPKLCDEFLKKDQRIRVIHKKNEGVAFARRDGVLASTGEYVTFCDADDMFDVFALEKVAKAIYHYSPDIVTFSMTRDLVRLGEKGIRSYYDRKKIVEKIFPYLLEDKNGKYYTPGVCGAVYKRQLYMDNQLAEYKIVVGEDLACKKAVIFHAQSIFDMEDKLYYYRVNSSSVTESRKAFPWDGPELIAKHITSKIDVDVLDMREQLNRVITHQLFVVAKSQFANSDKSYSQIKNDIKKNLQKPIYKNAVENCHYNFWYIKGIAAKFALKYKCCLLMWIYWKMEM